MPGTRPEARTGWERYGIPAVAPVLGLVAVYVLVAVPLGASRRTLERDALYLLAPVLLVGAVALAAWWAARRREEATERSRAEQERLVEERDRALAEAQAEQARLAQEGEQVKEAARGERERLERELRRRGQALDREHELNARLQQSRRAEREWNRELRSQIERLQEEHGMLAHTQDPRALVLRAAIGLVGAQKGLLVSRADRDGDGDLDLLVSHGFDHDPERSAVAQRFARQVLERDETIREDEPTDGGGRRTPADREIESLVAIPLYLHDRFAGVVVLANREGGFEHVEDELLLALGDHVGAALQSGQLRGELRDAHRAALRMLSETMAARDPVLQQEAGELAVHATALARELGLDDRDRDVLVCAALLRDVGHLALSEQMLMRPGPLMAEEIAVVELHPRIGFNIVRQLPALREVAFVVLYHHERWDGAGYPAGLRAEAIPSLARALAILDAYGAMIHDRRFRAALPREEAIERLVAAAGLHFDPEITQLFVEHLRRTPHEPGRAISDAVIEALPFGAGADAPGLLGEITAPATDYLTLLGSHRAFQEDAQAAARTGHDFSVVLVQLEDLARVNAEASYLAGDRLIQTAARHAQRAAARTGSMAYRDSGRRLALLADGDDRRSADDLISEVRTEFLAGPSVRITVAESRPGETGPEVVERARAALITPS